MSCSHSYGFGTCSSDTVPSHIILFTVSLFYCMLALSQLCLVQTLQTRQYKACPMLSVMAAFRTSFRARLACPFSVLCTTKCLLSLNQQLQQLAPSTLVKVQPLLSHCECALTQGFTAICNIHIVKRSLIMCTGIVFASACDDDCLLQQRAAGRLAPAIAIC